MGLERSFMKKLMVLSVLLLFFGCPGRKVKPSSPNPHLNIQIKDYGLIRVELLPKDAPMNVANLAKLAGKKFYDGLAVHRVIKGLLIQTGCPRGDGSGFPGYYVDDEISPALAMLKGTVAMANKGPNTNGSQFFMCLRDCPEFEGAYTIVGKVVKGMDIAVRVSEVKVDFQDSPRQRILVEKIWVE